MVPLKGLKPRPGSRCVSLRSIPRRVAFACSGLVLLALFFTSLLYTGPPRIHGLTVPDKPSTPDSAEGEALSAHESDFYTWQTRSQFKPVKQDTTDKSVQDLCAAFPKHLLRDIQPVLKTGHAVLENRVRTQLQSTSACLDDNILIFSDLDEGLGGHQVLDVLADLRPDFVHGNGQLESYAPQKELAANGTLKSAHASKAEGWKLDKSYPKSRERGVCGRAGSGTSFTKTIRISSGTTCFVCWPTSIPMSLGTLVLRRPAQEGF